MCIELFFILLILLCGLFLGAILLVKFGFIYGIIGFSVGIAFGYLLLRFWHLLTKIFPYVPSCANQKCKQRDYNYLYDDERGRMFECCGCGDLYLKTQTRFIKVFPHNIQASYMKKSMGRWVKDC